MHVALTAILRSRIVAIVRLTNYDRVLDVTQALLTGGISVIEYTLTGQGAVVAIEKARTAYGESAIIGAGTVLTPEAVQDVSRAGAQFVVTPVLKRSVIDACHQQALPIICGALTPTEIQTAHEAGAALIKVFPARQMGPQYIRDVLAPLPHVRLLPTGGVNAQNIGAYLDAGAVAVAIGGNLVTEQSVAAGDWASIASQAAACVSAVHV